MVAAGKSSCCWLLLMLVAATMYGCRRRASKQHPALSNRTLFFPPTTKPIDPSNTTYPLLRRGRNPACPLQKSEREKFLLFVIGRHW